MDDGQTKASKMTTYLPRAAATKEEMHALRAKAWMRDGVLSIRDDDERLTWPERELVRQLGERLYGPRSLLAQRGE